jgi:hypothetical protein
VVRGERQQDPIKGSAVAAVVFVQYLPRIYKLETHKVSQLRVCWSKADLSVG